ECSVQPGCRPIIREREIQLLPYQRRCLGNLAGKHPASPHDLSALGSHLLALLVPPPCGGSEVGSPRIANAAALNARNVCTPINGGVVECSGRLRRHRPQLALSQLATVTHYKCLIFLVTCTCCNPVQQGFGSISGLSG